METQISCQREAKITHTQKGWDKDKLVERGKDSQERLRESQAVK